MATETFVNVVTNATDGVATETDDLIPAVRDGATIYLKPGYFGGVSLRARVDNGASPWNNVAIANNTETAITFDNEVYDVGGFFSIGTPTRLTVPSGADGAYLISGSIEWANTSTTGIRRLRIVKNGTDTLAKAEDGITTHTNRHQQFLTIPALLVATDYIQLIAYQTSGGSLNILQEDYWSPMLTMVYLSS